MQRPPAPDWPPHSPIGWQLLLIVAVSGAYEALFLHHGIGWLFDEGWPLYAAMRLHAGGVLYLDTLFPFPPGHLLMAWVAYGIDPPGIILARIFYALFTVALCASIYLLGCRITRPSFALLAGLLVALAAPRSHLSQLLFGYRYLVFSVMVLLALSARLQLSKASPPTAETRRLADRWMFAAGVAAGVALYFRLTPAFAVSCGVMAALLTHSRAWRVWLRDGAAYGLGMIVVVLPILAWFQSTVGLDVMWREVVTRIVALQSAQSLPSPELSLLPASADRKVVYEWFIGLQYRLYILMYAGYALGLLLIWARGLRGGRAFRHSLLLAIVVWGGLYLLRALGRSDDHHLMSALPPACVVIAHAVGVVAGRLGRRLSLPGWQAHASTAAAIVLLVGAWVAAQQIDVYLDPRERGAVPIEATGGQVSVRSATLARRIDGVVRQIRQSTSDDAVVLDLTAGPLFQVLTGRLGPGYIDVVSPGIFLSEDEERSFVARLAESPPQRIIWPRAAFDKIASRSVVNTAPLVSTWVEAHYEEEARVHRYSILRPRDGRVGATSPLERAKGNEPK